MTVVLIRAHIRHTAPTVRVLLVFCWCCLVISQSLIVSLWSFVNGNYATTIACHRHLHTCVCGSVGVCVGGRNISKITNSYTIQHDFRVEYFFWVYLHAGIARRGGSLGQRQRVWLVQGTMGYALVLGSHLIGMTPAEEAAQFVCQRRTLGRHVEHALSITLTLSLPHTLSLCIIFGIV